MYTTLGWFRVHAHNAAQKMGQKPTVKRKEIELSFLHHSIRLDKLSTVHSKFGLKWCLGLFWAENWLFWPLFEICRRIRDFGD